MTLSEDISIAAEREVPGESDYEFSFLENFSLSKVIPPNPQLINLEQYAVQDLRPKFHLSEIEISSVVRNLLSLLGGTTFGLAIPLPVLCGARAKTVIMNLAIILSEFALNNNVIGDEEFEIFREICGRMEKALGQASAGKWPEMKQFSSGNENVLLGFHYDLCATELYANLAPFWQRAIISKVGSGNLVAPSSMSAFLTPLRHFTRCFPLQDFPPSGFHSSPEDRFLFEGKVKAFFQDPDKFSFSHRTRDDYCSTVILALRAEPGNCGSNIWTWKYPWHVSQMDNDPTEAIGIDDGFRDEAYLAAVRETAESVGDLPTLAFLQEIFPGDKNKGKEPTPLPKEDQAFSLSRQELAKIYSSSADRYAMVNYHTPINQNSLSPHIICTFDHWLGSTMNGRERLVWAFLFHLLLMTGRSLDWALSIRINPNREELDCGFPIYDPGSQSIATETMLKLELPRTPATEGVRSAYIPITPRITIPVCGKAAQWVRRVHIENGQRSTSNLLFSHPDGSPITKSEVVDSVIRPFIEYMASRQPGIPTISLGRIRKAFWCLFTWQGLSPEDATIISDQYYLEVRAPMFYACRSHTEFQESYQTACLAVTQSIGKVYKELFPGSAPFLFPNINDAFRPLTGSGSIYYGSCYCPKPEMLRKLICEIHRSMIEEWGQAGPHRRFDLLSYACAFGLSVGLGLRVGETAGLTSQSIDLRGGTIAVNGKADRFYEEMRILPIPNSLKDPLLLLRTWSDQLGTPKEIHSPFFHVFQGRPSATPLSRERLWRQLRIWETKASAGEGTFRWHALRHGVATYLLRDGSFTFPERSYFLGHVAGQQWLEDLRPGEQQAVFDQFNSVISRMMGELAFDLSAFLRIDKEGPNDNNQ